MLQRREFVLRQLEDDAGSQAVAHHVRHGAEAIPARDTHKQFVTSLVGAKPCMLGSDIHSFALFVTCNNNNNDNKDF